MYLREALGISAVDEIDPSRPLQLGGRVLSAEAATEAVRIIAGGDFSRNIEIYNKDIDRPFYWVVSHIDEGNGEILGIPSDEELTLPTAIEIGIVRALVATPPGEQSKILSGNAEILLGQTSIFIEFSKIWKVIQKPLVGDSIFLEDAGQVIVRGEASALLGALALNCLSSSFRTAPLKFRFLELYRIMEARFLEQVNERLLRNFDAEPSIALAEAADSLKSEMNQFIGLAETQKEAFEACWVALDKNKSRNQFTSALFRRISKRKLDSGPKWQTGAVLIYQMRCAIVHAGAKDMIFERFPDGDDAVISVIPAVERAALLLLGIDVIMEK